MFLGKSTTMSKPVLSGCILVALSLACNTDHGAVPWVRRLLSKN